MAVKAMKSVRRVLVPRVLVSLYYSARHRAAVSPHAEVERGGLVTLGPKTRVASFCKIKATVGPVSIGARVPIRSEEHTSELQSLMRNPYTAYCLTKKNTPYSKPTTDGKQKQQAKQ